MAIDWLDDRWWLSNNDEDSDDTDEDSDDSDEDSDSYDSEEDDDYHSNGYDQTNEEVEASAEVDGGEEDFWTSIMLLEEELALAVEVNGRQGVNGEEHNGQDHDREQECDKEEDNGEEGQYGEEEDNCQEVGEENGQGHEEYGQGHEEYTQDEEEMQWLRWVSDICDVDRYLDEVHIPIYLYHYTDKEGVLDILRSRRITMSSGRSPSGIHLTDLSSEDHSRETILRNNHGSRWWQHLGEADYGVLVNMDDLDTSKLTEVDGIGNRRLFRYNGEIDVEVTDIYMT